MHRGSRRRLAIAALIGLAPACLRAQEAPRFTIQTITVEGAQRETTRRIVSAETLLAAGSSYSEEELRQAVYRVKRLPFIVRADFELRRGSERGLYALAIAVEETRPFFFLQDVELFSVSPERAVAAFGYDHGGGIYVHNAATAAGRVFLGARTAAFAAIDDNEHFQAGVARYGLFGRGGSAALTWAQSICCRREVLPLGLDPGFVLWETRKADHATLSLDLPLAGSRSLRASLSWLGGSAESRRGLLDDFAHFQFFAPGGDDLRRWTANVGWFYDTADDPLFPTRGMTVSGSLEMSRLTAPARQGEFADLDPSRRESDARFLALAATGRRTWSLSPRQAVSLGGRLAVGRSRIENLVRDLAVQPGVVDLDTLETSLEARYSVSLWGFERTRDQGDLRWEASSRYGWETTSPSFGGPLRQLSLATSLAFRNGWGVFRFGLTYLDLQRPR